ncbi:MAG: hypothetical protein KZQ89_02960 [Candidatus Thiodiazotropha sp. (ex Lucinoma kastoroae)]|nr:hypothetical protein [Candidatus Thiodiazotropha sp. (ex Lucinoma kastoroae)]
MVLPEKSFNTASEADLLPPSERAENLDSNGYEKSIDERSFSDFKIDGSEKDWRQDAIEATGNNAYNGKNKENDKVDNLRDVVDLANELREARQEQMMRFSNGFEFTQEEFEEANDKLQEEIEADPEKFAEKHDISVAEALLVLEMSKDAKKSGTFDEDAMRAKYDDKLVDIYQGEIEDTVKSERNADNITDIKLDSEHANVDKSADLTDAQQTAEAQVVDEGEAELDFLETENISTSVAKAVSPEETTVANINCDFCQAANTTIADANTPAQDITHEPQIMVLNS